jgi:hypothetical protein
LTIEEIDDEHVNIIGDECMSITKIAPLYDILAINFDINTDTHNTLKNLSTYDPNEDDPLNKYTYEAKHRGLRPPLTPTGGCAPPLTPQPMA